MAEPDWWRSAAIYQLYIRSFAGGDGDGDGDIAGIRARLPYLAQLGVDAIWVNPWYPTPTARPASGTCTCSPRSSRM